MNMQSGTRNLNCKCKKKEKPNLTSLSSIIVSLILGCQLDKCPFCCRIGFFLKLFGDSLKCIQGQSDILFGMC